MSDCNDRKELFSVPGVMSHWQRDYMAHFIDDARTRCGASAPDEKKRLDDLEEHYHMEVVWDKGTTLNSIRTSH